MCRSLPLLQGRWRRGSADLPPAEEKSLIASLTVKGRDEYRNSHSEYFYTYQYSYDEAGRVTSVALRGDDNDDWSFTYGDRTMTIADDSENIDERIEFQTDANRLYRQG